jgi:hypothetical protein
LTLLRRDIEEGDFLNIQSMKKNKKAMWIAVAGAVVFLETLVTWI